MVSDQNGLQVRNPRGPKPQIQTVDDGSCLYCIDGPKSKMMIVLQGSGGPKPVSLSIIERKFYQIRTRRGRKPLIFCFNIGRRLATLSLIGSLPNFKVNHQELAYFWTPVFSPFE